MKKLLAVVIVVTSLTGCAAALPYVAGVSSAIANATLILDQVQSVSDAWFAAKPDADAQAVVNNVILDVRAALDKLSQIAHNTEGATDGNAYQVALANFQAAFDGLMNILANHGIVSIAGSKGYESYTGVVIPRPLLLK